MKVGIAGFGTIGRQVAHALDQGIEGLQLVAVSSGNLDKARDAATSLNHPVAVVPIHELVRQVDVVVECAPTDAFSAIAIPALDCGCTLLTVSGAAILQHPDIVAMARAAGSRIILASGALLGLDAVRAAAEGNIHSVTMVTRKPPSSLKKARFIHDNNIDISNLQHPLKIFAGSARQGAEKFPANVNVAAALGLAGIGADDTRLEIWADPTKTLNTHTIVVEADSARLQMTIENVPTLENPGTGKITALSVIAALRSMVCPLRVGT